MVTAIPIYIEPDAGDMMRGVIEVRGLLRIQNSTLEIEYQTSSNSITFASANTISLDLNDVTRIDYRRRIFSSRLTFHTLTANHFDGVPGAEGERLTIRFARKHRAQASRIAWDLQTAVEDRKLRRISDQR
jgi:hypothetical protein